MEKGLFDWNEWDGDPELMIFYNPVLKVQIGDFPVGTKFGSAAINFEKGQLEFYNGDNVAATFRLEYKVAERLA